MSRSQESRGQSNPPELGAESRVTRRGFLHTAVASAVIGVGPTLSWRPVRGTRSSVQTVPTPGAALHELVAGNERFVADRLTSTHLDLQTLRARTVDKQQPFAGVLACADARVPVELIFDQSIGRLFVTRVAGNIVTPEIIASLEYAVAELGVRALLILGHSSCGAVTAAMKSEIVPGQISSLYPHLQAAVDQSGGNVGKAIEANARTQAQLLRTSSTVIRDATGKGSLKVVAGVYDLGTGRVTLS